MHHRYKAFGLNIESDILCPELLPSVVPPDVIIKTNSFSTTLLGAKASGACFQAAPGTVLLTCHAATFLVSEGSRILVNPASQTADKMVRLILLESAFGALLHQRGILPLHGSAVRVKEGAIIFVGPSASGKSTLAAALTGRGYSMLADEICAVSFDDDGNPSVSPAYPQLSLWPDVIEKLGKKKEDLEPLRKRLQKVKMIVGDSFCESTLPLVGIYVLNAVNAYSSELVPMSGAEKIEHLITNTYQPWLLDGLGGKENNFEMSAIIAQCTPMCGANHPKTPPDRLDDFVDMVEEDLI
jgi:hypothetical protein